MLEDRIRCVRFPEGLRYLRGVDVVRLVDLAPQAAQVPDLFEVYNRELPPVSLPDFLGALSVLIAAGILEHRAAGTHVD